MDTICIYNICIYIVYIYIYMYICICIYICIYVCIYIYQRYHRSSRYHPCHPWQRKIISQTFQLDLINQLPTLDVEKMVDPQITNNIFIKRKLSQKFWKKSPSVRLSKNIQTSNGFTTPQRPGVLNKKHQGTQVSGLRICIIQLQDHRIRLLLFNGFYRANVFFVKSPGPSLRKWTPKGMKWMFPKNSGQTPPKSIHFNRGFPWKKPSILGYHYFWKHPNNDQNQLEYGRKEMKWKIHDSKKSPTGPAERTPEPKYLIALATYLGVRW